MQKSVTCIWIEFYTWFIHAAEWFLDNKCQEGSVLCCGVFSWQQCCREPKINIYICIGCIKCVFAILVICVLEISLHFTAYSLQPLEWDDYFYKVSVRHIPTSTELSVRISSAHLALIKEDFVVEQTSRIFSLWHVMWLVLILRAMGCHAKGFNRTRRLFLN